MPDGMNVDPKVIEDIGREVKAIGDNWKELQTSMQTDLASVRKIAEDAGNKIGPEVKAQIDAFTASVISKQEASETAITRRLSSIETKLNRGGMGNGGDDDVKTRAAARRFHILTLASRGQLKAGARVLDEHIDFASIKAYEESFPTYLRRDERGVETKAMEVGSDPDGGYWVPDQMSARIITQIYETSPVRQIATIENISTDALEVPNDLGQVDAGWVGEQETRTTTNTPGVGVLRIPAHEMYAMPSATQKLLEDASIDVSAWISGKIADRFARIEATAFVAGTGVKQPRGFLTYPAGTSNNGQIEQIHSGNAALLTADGLINLTFGLKDFYLANAQFLMQRQSVGQVMLLKDLQGRYLWQPSIQAGTPTTLLSYPVQWAADMPAIAAGALPVAFGDFKAGYTIVDRLGISALRDPYTAKPFVLFYTRKRVGGDVVNFEAIKLLLISA